MGWWFGRKSAPADVRPFVPAWLSNDSAEEGFARSREGMNAMVRSSGLIATYRGGSWDIGTAVCSNVSIGGVQVVGARTAAIATPSGGSSVDAECRSAVAQVLAALREHGLIAT